LEHEGSARSPLAVLRSRLRSALGVQLAEQGQATRISDDQGEEFRSPGIRQKQAIRISTAGKRERGLRRTEGTIIDQIALVGTLLIGKVPVGSTWAILRRGG
jgi:hypothetical protein